MINYEQWCRLKQLAERDRLSAAQISRALGLAARTVRKWLTEPYRPRKRIERASVLDPFKGQIMGMLKEHPYSAVQVLTMLQDQGFHGGITIVKDYIQQIRPRGQEAYLTLSFAPGECAQVDWGSWEMIAVGNTRRRLSFFVMVLGYSRMLYVEFTLAQSQEHFLSCHRRAFEFFGGVPAKIMCDNCKTAVLSHPYGLTPVLNPRYADFAGHYGFTVKACNARKANEKGIVENAVGYVKHNFLAGRPIGEFSSLNPAVEIWLEQIANVRIHGRTRRRPACPTETITGISRLPTMSRISSPGHFSPTASRSSGTSSTGRRRIRRRRTRLFPAEHRMSPILTPGSRRPRSSWIMSSGVPNRLTTRPCSVVRAATTIRIKVVRRWSSPTTAATVCGRAITTAKAGTRPSR